MAPKKKPTDEAAEPVLAESTTPAVSDVLPGGGTRVGALLRVAVPVKPASGATLIPTSSPASEGTLAVLSALAPGEEYDTLAATSFPLSDGGYANAQRLRIVEHADPGCVVCEVVL